MSKCQRGPACDLGFECPDVVESREVGGLGLRWFVTMGHCGFNSPANNRTGYSSRLSAVMASRRYEQRGRAAREGR